MKILSLILLIVFYGVNSIFAQNTIQTSIEHFTNDASLKHASISFKVTDLATGTTVSEFNPNVTLPTASTAKLFSTATALDILGPDYRATTRIYRDGEIDSAGVLNGTLWIRGGGDPSLGSKYFNQEDHQLDFLDNWVKQLKELGITEIKGAVWEEELALV